MESQRRGQQYLEPVTSPPKDKQFAVFDLESKDEDTQKAGFTRPFQVGFFDGQSYTSFRNKSHVQVLPWYERAVAPGGCIDQFMRHILGSPHDRTESPFAGFDVYAHNMGSFDGLFLPAWLERNNQWISYKVMPVQARIQAIEVWRYNKNRYRGGADAIKRANKKDRKQYGVIRILDSFRVLPSALDKIAKAFGLEGKLKEMSLDTHEDDPLWEKYNEIDCIQLFKVIEKYKELIIQQLGGEVGITAPSTAIKLLRRKYLPNDYKIYRNMHFENCTAAESCDGCAHNFFRAGYFGGRTEIYTRKGAGWYYDVNSSYPFSMTKPQPVGEMVELGENEDFTRYANDLENYVGFVRCTVEIPKDTYLPPLPVQHQGKLKFPAGRFSGTWDWCELRAFRRIGAKILHVEKSVWLRSYRFLTQYVRDLYAMRKKDDPKYRGPALSEVAKLTLNSTFGKFGMDPERIEMVILKPGEEEPWDSRYPGESDGHRDKRKRAAKEGDNSFHVTTPLGADEPDEEFEARRKRERAGDFSGPRWRVPDLPTSSGIYEHDSLIRVRDIHVDAAYIIPHIAAHITASSRVLLWGFAMDVLDRCQTCQTCHRPYIEHFNCKTCGRSSVEHVENAEVRPSGVCGHFVPPCSNFVACKHPRSEHDGKKTKCNFVPHEIYYSDTDSLITSYPDYPESKELGGLKKEFEEPITIEAYAPKMYKLSKPTPFEGAHVRRGEGKDAKKACEVTCWGCKKPTDEDKAAKKPLVNGRVRGEHAVNDKGEKLCKKECPGCATMKVLMKGVPKDMRTEETLEKLLVRREEVNYPQHEKLGTLAKRGFRDTPRMQQVKKSMRSEYDKRIMNRETGTTEPLILEGDQYLSVRFQQVVQEGIYETPDWLAAVVARE